MTIIETDPEAVDEQLAIMEIDGGLPRPIAEAYTRLLVVARSEGVSERLQRAMDDLIVVVEANIFSREGVA